MQETKRLLRGDLAEQWQNYLPQEADYAWKQLSSAGTVAKLKGVMDRLSSGGKKSKL